jgi:hypothetical protein
VEDTLPLPLEKRLESAPWQVQPCPPGAGAPYLHEANDQLHPMPREVLPEHTRNHHLRNILRKGLPRRPGRAAMQATWRTLVPLPSEETAGVAIRTQPCPRGAGAPYPAHGQLPAPPDNRGRSSLSTSATITSRISQDWLPSASGLQKPQATWRTLVPLPLEKRPGSLFEPSRVPQGQGPRVLHATHAKLHPSRGRSSLSTPAPITSRTSSRVAFLGVRVAETAGRVEDMVAAALENTAGVGAWPDPAASTSAEPRVVHAAPGLVPRT